MTLASFTPHRTTDASRPRGCYTCTHFHGVFYAEHLLCERQGLRVIGVPRMGFAYWQPEPGSVGEQHERVANSVLSDIKHLPPPWRMLVSPEVRALPESLGNKEKGDIMITLRRTVTFPGKNFAACLAWSREICGYTKSKVGVDTTIQIPYGGNPNRFCYVVTFDSLASFEQANQKLMSDPKFLEMNGKASDIFIVGSAVDEIWSSL